MAHLRGWQLMLAVAESSAGSSSGVVDVGSTTGAPPMTSHVLWASLSMVAGFLEGASQEQVLQEARVRLDPCE